MEWMPREVLVPGTPFMTGCRSWLMFELAFYVLLIFIPGGSMAKFLLTIPPDLCHDWTALLFGGCHSNLGLDGSEQPLL